MDNSTGLARLISMWKSRFNWASRVCSSRSVWFAKLSAIYQDPEHKSWKTFTYISQMCTNATIRLRMKWLWCFACVSRSLLYDRVINSRWLSVLEEVVSHSGRKRKWRTTTTTITTMISPMRSPIYPVIDHWLCSLRYFVLIVRMMWNGRACSRYTHRANNNSKRLL